MKIRAATIDPFDAETPSVRGPSNVANYIPQSDSSVRLVVAQTTIETDVSKR